MFLMFCECSPWTPSNISVCFFGSVAQETIYNFYDFVVSFKTTIVLCTFLNCSQSSAKENTYDLYLFRVQPKSTHVIYVFLKCSQSSVKNAIKFVSVWSPAQEHHHNRFFMCVKDNRNDLFHFESWHKKTIIICMMLRRSQREPLQFMAFGVVAPDNHYNLLHVE